MKENARRGKNMKYAMIIMALLISSGCCSYTTVSKQPDCYHFKYHTELSEKVIRQAYKMKHPELTPYWEGIRDANKRFYEYCKEEQGNKKGCWYR